MALQKKDFIEIEFTGKLREGGVFDSNIKEDLEKINPNLKETPEPFVLCLGEGMFLKGVEDFLIGKEIGKYEIELSPENAFGQRNTQLVQRIPIRVFREQRLNPIPGFSFNFDGRIGKVLASSGGRVIVDFNNPVAGKDVVYTVKVLRKVDDLKEKAHALIHFLFRGHFEFEVKDKKIILEADEQLRQFLSLFKDKFKDMLDLELDFKEPTKKAEDVHEHEHNHDEHEQGHEHEHNHEHHNHDEHEHSH